MKHFPKASNLGEFVLYCWGTRRYGVDDWIMLLSCLAGKQQGGEWVKSRLSLPLNWTLYFIHNEISPTEQGN